MFKFTNSIYDKKGERNLLHRDYLEKQYKENLQDIINKITTNPNNPIYYDESINSVVIKHSYIISISNNKKSKELKTYLCNTKLIFHNYLINQKII